MTTETDHTSNATGAPPPRWVLKTTTRLHVMLHRLTGGRLFNTLAGDDVCFVTMKGATSGRMLTIPLMYVPYRAGVLLVASQGGAPKNPAWYHNLVKHPDFELIHRGSRMKLRARIATVPTRSPTSGPSATSTIPPIAEYRTRTSRDIPIFVCESNGLRNANVWLLRSSVGRRETGSAQIFDHFRQRPVG